MTGAKPPQLRDGADTICHVLDERDRSLLLDALIKEEQEIRSDIKLCSKINAESDIPDLKSRLERVRALYDLVDASWVTCEHTGDCSAPTGCNHRGRNRERAEEACGGAK